MGGNNRSFRGSSFFVLLSMEETPIFYFLRSIHSVQPRTAPPSCEGAAVGLFQITGPSPVVSYHRLTTVTHAPVLRHGSLLSQCLTVSRFCARYMGCLSIQRWDREGVPVLRSVRHDMILWLGSPDTRCSLHKFGTNPTHVTPT